MTHRKISFDARKALVWACAIAATAALSACAGGGGGGGGYGGGGRHGGMSGGQRGGQQRQQSVIEAIESAQETALARAQGGKPDTPMPWAEQKSGIEGTLQLDPKVLLTGQCHRYKSTLSFATQTFNGVLTACPQGDGTWKTYPTTP